MRTEREPRAQVEELSRLLALRVAARAALRKARAERNERGGPPPDVARLQAELASVERAIGEIVGRTPPPGGEMDGSAERPT